MQSNSLKNSRFAPKTPAENLALSRAERVKKEKETATRLLSRLRWKAESLAASYIRAVEISYIHVDQNGYMHPEGATRFPFVLGMESKQVESMFQIDFFEWYTVLERYITHCLSVVGVQVSGSAPRTNVNGLKHITNPILANKRTEASHQFHANLLQALDDRECPLHAALGNQDARIQLGLAKDYRNRWKDADEKLNAASRGSEEEARKAIKLEQLDLAQMLNTIIFGCEQALSVVCNRSDASVNTPYTSRDFESLGYDGFDGMQLDEDTPIGFMDDAMDLD
ncbi:hypothetical protein K491DRAFT_641859 [Lophiostoma macrostomum CBS 122681]|uniref:Uncharacterized protein n=1 Tax=Lophiostoma macrostomum CBS 122681 TaxID=1314788 RepID=A0A6A6SRK4_9PLEO|nr:hypothetical protein K491DRAFT_641859 [Lophiostoma macrostomum CBS 122681]